MGLIDDGFGVIYHRHPGSCPCVDKCGAHAVIRPAAYVQLARQSSAQPRMLHRHV